MGFLIAAMPWIKAFHVISVIAWMAALLYLPRLFVYHAAAPVVVHANSSDRPAQASLAATRGGSPQVGPKVTVRNSESETGKRAGVLAGRGSR